MNRLKTTGERESIHGNYEHKEVSPTKREVEQLHAASKIVCELLQWKYEAEILYLELAILPHAIAAITVELAPKRLSGDSQT